MVTRPSQTQDKFIVRLPDGMRDQISAAAKANKRTMTAEIVSRLERSFQEERLLKIEGTAEAAFELATDLAVEAYDERIAKRLDDLETRISKIERRDLLKD
jgi:hypothetical protein